MNQFLKSHNEECELEQSSIRAEGNIDASAELGFGDQGFMIPINAVIRIFCFIRQDDLENCKLVCKTWKNVIDYADKQLPKRRIDALILSTAREYSICIYNEDKKRRYCYKKYFSDRDIEEVEKKKHGKESFDVLKFRFPCGTPYPRILARMVFETPYNLHHDICKNIHPMTYHLNVNYSKKLFTPPLIYYERLKKMLHRSEIKRLIFHGFTFTSLFVEKIFEYVNEPFSKIDEVILHGCNLRYLTPQTFHILLDGFHANAYFIQKSRFCLPAHISPPLFEKPSILLAKSIYVDYAIERHTDAAVIFPIDDEFIMKFAKMLLNVGRIERQFFGIGLSRVTHKIIAPYERLALQSNSQFQKPFMMIGTNENEEEHLNLRWLYKILLFGEIRCNLSN